MDMEELLKSLKAFLKPEVIWALVGIVLLLMEFTLPGLIIFFFGVGALVVALVCLLTDISINVQLLIFIVSSIVLLLVLRRWLKGIFMGHSESKQRAAENPSEFAGRKARVTVAITPQAGGRVELNGTTWKAVAEEEISEGSIVEVISKDNITLSVRAL